MRVFVFGDHKYYTFLPLVVALYFKEDLLQPKLKKSAADEISMDIICIPESCCNCML